MHQLKTCARTFGEILYLTNLDLSILQNGVMIGTSVTEVHKYISEAVAHINELMTEEQKNWREFDNWLRAMMDFAVFGSEENPIELE